MTLLSGPQCNGAPGSIGAQKPARPAEGRSLACVSTDHPRGPSSTHMRQITTDKRRAGESFQ